MAYNISLNAPHNECCECMLCRVLEELPSFNPKINKFEIAQDHLHCRLDDIYWLKDRWHVQYTITSASIHTESFEGVVSLDKWNKAESINDIAPIGYLPEWAKI